MLVTKRLFLGIPLTLSQADDFCNFQNQQSKTQLIRWVSMENLHITIHFIGNFPIVEIPELITKLTILESNVPSFKLEFKQYQLDPGKKPSMLWAVYYPQESFHGLQKTMSQMVHAPNFKKPIIHCTIARFKPKPENLSFNFSNNVRNPVIEIRQLILFESLLHPTGSTYKALESFNLG